MTFQSLQIGNRCARLPLIQGGMGVGVSLSHLAGAVAKEGGVGIISTAQIGFKDPDFYKDPKAANLRAVKSEFKKARAIAGPDCKGLLGFNIMAATRDYPDYVKEAVSAGADVIITGAGLPVDLPLYTAGSDTKIAPIVSSEKAARIILKRWDRNYGRTADFLVIENAHAGGHLGFSVEQLSHITDPDYDKNYDEEICRIITVTREYGEKYGLHIPVIVAGGIMCSSDAIHYFSLGADGIQVATPFVTTKECDAHPAFKEAYIKAGKEDIEIIKSPVGMPGRAIHNRFIEKISQNKENISHCCRCLNMCDPKKAPYCITEALIRAVTGDVENGLVFCGDNAQYLNRITTVHEVIESVLPVMSQSLLA